jgi:hypothetical protein
VGTMNALNIELFLVFVYLIYLLFRSDLLAFNPFVWPLKASLSDEAS